MKPLFWRRDAIRIFIPWHLAYDHSRISNINALHQMKKQKQQQQTHFFKMFICSTSSEFYSMPISKYHIGFLHDNHLIGYKYNDSAQSLWWTVYFLLTLIWSVASFVSSRKEESMPKFSARHVGSFVFRIREFIANLKSSYKISSPKLKFFKILPTLWRLVTDLMIGPDS